MINMRIKNNNPQQQQPPATFKSISFVSSSPSESTKAAGTQHAPITQNMIKHTKKTT
jgi:hypothetical protein